MKALTCATMAAVAALALSPAYAQSPKTKNFSVVNCSALKGEPDICVFNETDEQVTDIACETIGFFGGKGEASIDMPKGGIPAHSMTIVKVKKNCKTTLILTVLGGGERRIPNVNTDMMTVIEVPNR